MAAKKEVDRFIEVDRKEFLALLAPIAEKMGISLHDVTGGTLDHSGLEFGYIERTHPGAARRTARIHVFDPVVY